VIIRMASWSAWLWSRVQGCRLDVSTIGRTNSIRYRLCRESVYERRARGNQHMSRKRIRSPGGNFLRATALISVVASRSLSARSEDVEFSSLFFAFWLPCCLAQVIWFYVQSDRSLSRWIRVWGFLDADWWGPIVGLAFAVLTSPDILGCLRGCCRISNALTFHMKQSIGRYL
jgi:hypothetical protein